MKCQIYYNYEDESWPSGSQERRKDRLLRRSILHVPCSLAANLRAILVRGVFRHYVSLCSNKFLLEYLTLESDNNTSVSVVKRLVGWSGNRRLGSVSLCARCRGLSQHRSGPRPSPPCAAWESRARALPRTEMIFPKFKAPSLLRWAERDFVCYQPLHSLREHLNS